MVKVGEVLVCIDVQDLKLVEVVVSVVVMVVCINCDQVGVDYKCFVDLQCQGFISIVELECCDLVFKVVQVQFEQVCVQVDVQGNQVGYVQFVVDGVGVVMGVDVELGQVLVVGMLVVCVVLDGLCDIVFLVFEDQIFCVKVVVSVFGVLKVRLWGSDKILFLMLCEVVVVVDLVMCIFLIKVDVGKLDVKFGQFVMVVLDLLQIVGVIKLLLDVVMQQSGKILVWVLDGFLMIVKVVLVWVGGVEGNEVVIVGGFNFGQEVVVVGVYVFNLGQKVKCYVLLCMIVVFIVVFLVVC